MTVNEAYSIPREVLDNLQHDLREIKLLLKGSPDMGQLGFGHRLADLERDLDEVRLSVRDARITVRTAAGIAMTVGSAFATIATLVTQWILR